MAHIDELVQKVTDPVLREALATQVRTLTDRKEFGLVFQHHLPETVRLPKQRIRRGDTVERRTVMNGQRYRVVSARATEPTVSVIELDTAGDPAGDVVNLLRSDLVVVKLFGEPVYPGFRQLGQVGKMDPSRPSHVIVNGENFHALQALEYTHLAKVDVIYIDRHTTLDRATGSTTTGTSTRLTDTGIQNGFLSSSGDSRSPKLY